jgi:hypothetical protein
VSILTGLTLELVSTVTGLRLTLVTGEYVLTAVLRSDIVKGVTVVSGVMTTNLLASELVTVTKVSRSGVAIGVKEGSVLAPSKAALTLVLAIGSGLAIVLANGSGLAIVLAIGSGLAIVLANSTGLVIVLAIGLLKVTTGAAGVLKPSETTNPSTSGLYTHSGSLNPSNKSFSINLSVVREHCSKNSSVTGTASTCDDSDDISFKKVATRVSQNPRIHRNADQPKA